MVVFEVHGREPYVASGATRDDDCVRQAWFATPLEHPSAAGKVTRIYSEWQPSAADTDFIRRTFPHAKLTYSFNRPAPDGWEAAFAAARRAMAEAAEREQEARAAQSMQHVADHGELVPVLWSQTSAKIQMLQFLPHRDLVPGRLHVALATVAPTPQGRIGMNHLTHAELHDRSFDNMLAAAAASLTGGLRVDGHTDPDLPSRGHLLVLQREGPFASSAVALPDFHEQMATALGDGRLLVGLPDPDTVLVTRMDSGWVDELQRAVLASPCPAGELVPSVLALESTGLRLLAERPEHQP